MATKKSRPPVAVRSQEIEKAVHVIRGQRVMLDFDLARLYGVPTSALNQAVRRNADRFPDDFAYHLTQQEFTGLISQIVTSNTRRGGRRKLPWTLAEHGVAMLSSVLKSPTAVRVNIEIMRAPSSDSAASWQHRANWSSSSPASPRPFNSMIGRSTRFSKCSAN